MKIKMISSEDKKEWLKETYEHLQKLKEDKYGDVRLDYIMLYELHEEEYKEIERLNNIINELEKWVKSEYDRYYNDKENIVFSNVEVIDFGRVLDKLKELRNENAK